MSLLLLTGLVGNLRVMVLLFTIVFLLLSVRLKNIFVASFLVSVFTIPFFNPNKYYSILVIRGLNLLVEFKGDYLLGYGLNISNIFILLSIIVLVREAILKKKKIILFLHKHAKLVILSAIAFFVIAMGASLKYSPFPEASFVWLVQYMQVFAVALMTLYLFVNHKRNFALIFPTILTSIFLQSVISFWQYLKQSSVGLPIEFTRIASFFATGLDEINTLFRVSGTFLFHNQLALIMLAMITVLAPYALRKKNLLYLFGCLLGLIVIVLTQGRSIWIATAIVATAFIRVYRKDVGQLVEIVGIRRLLLLGIGTFVGLAYIVIPRILLSFNAFYEGAGIPLRVKMIKEALEAFQLSPWIGYGVGTNEHVLFSLFPNGVMAVFPSAVHAAFVQLALEVGILGLGLFLIPFIYILRLLLTKTTLRKMPKERKDYLFSFIAGTFVFFLYYLFQPHVGIVEFPYLGLILGFGMISLDGT